MGNNIVIAEDYNYRYNATSRSIYRLRNWIIKN